MKKVTLHPVYQKNHTFYVMILDPREIAALVERVPEGNPQENQRPWNMEKVKEIALYVTGKMQMKKNGKKHDMMGLIPNAPIINLLSPMEVHYDQTLDAHYVLFPETAEEIRAYQSLNVIQIIDGQHRVLAFREDLREPEFSDETRYEMIFSTFFEMSDEDKRELFTVTNEKQTKVDRNLLRLLKKQLNLLESDEVFFDFVQLLNEEAFSPLKGRIKIGSNTVKKGYTEGELSKILDKSGTYAKLAQHVEEGNLHKMGRGLSNYIRAWEDVYGVKYSDPGKDILTKTAGLRYILYLFGDIMNILTEKDAGGTQEDFEELIRKLPEAIGIDNVFQDPTTSLAFRGEGATIKMAKMHGTQLIKYVNQSRKPKLGAAW